jgi:hypothetical protein
MNKRGRPRLAPEMSQLPACRVPAALHDAAINEAIGRDVPVCQVIRDALILHLQNRLQTDRRDNTQ